MLQTKGVPRKWALTIPNLRECQKRRGGGLGKKEQVTFLSFEEGFIPQCIIWLKHILLFSFVLFFFLFFLANICKTSPFNIFSFKTSFPYGCSVLYEQKKITFPLIAKSRIKQAYSKEHNWVFDFSKSEKGWLGSRFLCLKRDFCEK